MKGRAAQRFIHTAMPGRTRMHPGHGPWLARLMSWRKFVDETCPQRSLFRYPYSRIAAQIAAAALLLIFAFPAFASPWGRRGEPEMPRAAMGMRNHWMIRGFQHERPPRPPEQDRERGRYMRPPQNRPGREHLPEWYQNHRHMTFQQQERALRRQPGFNRLHPEQRQRILNRLHYLDSQPPAVRRRMMARNEAFERLSPERRQEVRAAAQAFQHMPQSRKQQLGRAFHILRTLPPNERTVILHSARFQAEYSPRERHILSNLLSIEPWQPQPPPPPMQPAH